MKKIVLASASPRRCDLLKLMGLEFLVVPSKVEEEIASPYKPEELAVVISQRKALNVAESQEDCIVIGADTIVVKDGILGKPRSEEEAYHMLKSLQGGWHEVITGVTVADSSVGRYLSSYERTRVKMRPMSDELIYAYIKTGEPMDKAGAYGIQGKGALLIERIDGCYFNVVGLPIMKLSSMLEEFGVNMLA